jgi:hypothetical protein
MRKASLYFLNLGLELFSTYTAAYLGASDVDYVIAQFGCAHAGKTGMNGAEVLFGFGDANLSMFRSLCCFHVALYTTPGVPWELTADSLPITRLTSFT